MSTVGRTGVSLETTSVCARSRGTPAAARARYRSVNACLDIRKASLYTRGHFVQDDIGEGEHRLQTRQHRRVDAIAIRPHDDVRHVVPLQDVERDLRLASG